MTFRSQFINAPAAYGMLLSFLLATSGSLCLGLHRALSQARVSLQPLLSVVVFFPNKLPDVDARRSTDSFRSLDPEIQSVEFISKEDAYKTALSDPVLSKSLMVLKENPLPSSAILRYSDQAWLQRTEPAETLRNIPEIAEIRWNPQSASHIRSIARWQQWTARLNGILGAVFLVWISLGLYRLITIPSPKPIVLIHLLLGWVAGGIVWGLFFWTLKASPVEATLCPPALLVWPVALGGLTALTCLGWGSFREN